MGSPESETPGADALEHVIVLVLENRSFDHILGHLPHPDPAFDGTAGHDYANRLDPADPRGTRYPVTDDAHYEIHTDPDHEHLAVMAQLAGVGDETNTGFVASYLHKELDTEVGGSARAFRHVWARRIAVAAGVAAVPLFVWNLAAGIASLAVSAAAVAGFLATRPKSPTPAQLVEAEAHVGEIMAGFAPDRVPVLSRLASEFGVCQRWFSSLPGETWPNRNFFHAASSSGSTDIELGFYEDPTIFERLDHEWEQEPRTGRPWHVYYGQFPPQVFFFTYVLERSVDHTSGLEALLADIRADRLPAYAFVEPHHGLLGRTPSCSQHPGNNLVGSGGHDFRAGERLVGEIYGALRATPEVFGKTVLLVTYDEHGGTYDHVSPPAAVAPGEIHDTWTRRFTRWATARTFPRYDFRRLGVRVPAIVISPWVPAGHLDATDRDHSCVPATLRSRFAPGQEPLTARDAHAVPFDALLSLPAPRPVASLPDLGAEMAALGNPPLFAGESSAAPAPGAPSQTEPTTGFGWQLIDLTRAIHRGTVEPVLAAQATPDRSPSAPAPTREAKVTRTRIVPGRERSRRRSPQDLHQLLDETEFVLGAIAADQQA